MRIPSIFSFIIFLQILTFVYPLSVELTIKYFKLILENYRFKGENSRWEHEAFKNRINLSTHYSKLNLKTEQNTSLKDYIKSNTDRYVKLYTDLLNLKCENPREIFCRLCAGTTEYVTKFYSNIIRHLTPNEYFEEMIMIFIYINATLFHEYSDSLIEKDQMVYNLHYLDFEFAVFIQEAILQVLKDDWAKEPNQQEYPVIYIVTGNSNHSLSKKGKYASTMKFLVYKCIKDSTDYEVHLFNQKILLEKRPREDFDFGRTPKVASMCNSGVLAIVGWGSNVKSSLEKVKNYFFLNAMESKHLNPFLVGNFKEEYPEEYAKYRPSAQNLEKDN